MVARTMLVGLRRRLAYQRAEGVLEVPAALVRIVNLREDRFIAFNGASVSSMCKFRGREEGEKGMEMV